MCFATGIDRALLESSLDVLLGASLRPLVGALQSY